MKWKCQSLSRVQLCNPKDCSLPGSSAHGILCPWNSPGKNTGVGSHSLLQGIFPAQGSNPGLLHCRQILYHMSHQGSLVALHPINTLLILVLNNHHTWSFYFPHTSHTHTHSVLYNCSWLLWICISVQREKNLKPISEPRENFIHGSISITQSAQLQCQGNIFSFNLAFFLSRKYFTFSIVKSLFFNLCVNFFMALQSSLLSWKASWRKNTFLSYSLRTETQCYPQKLMSGV